MPAKRLLIKLPEGTTATQGAHRMMTILHAHGKLPPLVQGQYRCVRNAGHLDAGAYCWWLASPTFQELAGSPWKVNELWKAHRSSGCRVDFAHDVSRHGCTITIP